MSQPYVPFTRGTLLTWEQHIAKLWENLLKTPYIGKLDFPLSFVDGDVFNYTQSFTTEGLGTPLLLYLQLQVSGSKVLTHTGTICINEKFYFFDPTGPEDVKLYEYSLDPATVEPTGGANSQSESD